jgi:hypothetical protein
MGPAFVASALMMSSHVPWYERMLLSPLGAGLALGSWVTLLASREFLGPGVVVAVAIVFAFALVGSMNGKSSGRFIITRTHIAIVGLSNALLTGYALREIVPSL